MKKSVSFILFAAIWIVACGSSVKPAVKPSPLPHSMKGYELYSWQAATEWHFTLLTGTNRQKTLEEITTGEDAVTPDGWVRISVQGVDALKSVLSRLPPKEEIVWVGNPQLQSGDIALPPKETIDVVTASCMQLGLVLSVTQ